MKKKSASISKYIDCIYIFRDDIEQIYDTLFEITSQNPQVEIDDYIIEDKSDFDKLNIETPQTLELNTPNIQVKIDKQHAMVFANNPNNSLMGYTYRIIQILEYRQKKIPLFLSKWSYRLFSTFMVVGILMAVVFKIINQGLLDLASVPLVLGFIFMLINILMSNLNYLKPQISLKYKKDQPSFFKRKKDDLIIGFALLLLGYLIGKI